MVFKIVNNWSHQQMAAHYRETIANILQNFDNNQHSSRQFYMDLAWAGLHNTKEFQTEIVNKGLKSKYNMYRRFFEDGNSINLDCQ